MHDIYNLKLPVDLVVLSACNTGLGKEVKGEGLIGLTRGFMYAGARGVVASLWKVDDDATSELMKHFYVGMFQKGLAPAALRDAQLALRSQKRWQSPYYWAAFVIQGEYDQKQFGVLHPSLKLVTFGAGIVILAVGAVFPVAPETKEYRSNKIGRLSEVPPEICEEWLEGFFDKKVKKGSGPLVRLRAFGSGEKSASTDLRQSPDARDHISPIILTVYHRT